MEIEIEPKNCKFCKLKTKCDHKDNSDRRSRKQNGHLRRQVKRCEPRFCPLNRIKIEFETSKYNYKGGKKI